MSDKRPETPASHSPSHADVSMKRQHLCAILDDLPVIVYLRAPDHSIHFANHAFRERFGDPGNAPCYQAIHKRSSPCEPCASQRILETRGSGQWQWTDGLGRGYQHYTRSLAGVDGDEAILELSIDVTRRSQAEADLELANARLHALSRRLVELQEEERRSIARELHDEAGQLLASLLFTLKMLQERAADPQTVAEEVERLIGLAEGAMENLHRLAVRLRPASLDQLGLEAALRQQCDVLNGHNGLEVAFAALGPERRLSPETETALYRIVQEALTNAVRHAGAGRIDVLLDRRSDGIRVLVRDDGAGFDPEAVSPERCLGLLGMQERAGAVGGELVVEATPRAGTLVCLKLPY
jgi:signal transduction histidine kinase